MTGAGVVIVTYNSETQICACLESALRWCTEIVVVDNASTDRSREMVIRFPGVRLVANSSNRGFAAAVNQGIALLDSKAVLLLNPDAELVTGLKALIEALADPNSGAAAGKLLHANGDHQRGFNVRRFPTPFALAFEALGCNRLWPSNPVNRRYRCFDLDPAAPADVEQPAGAFLLLKRDAWARLGGFDEDFHPLWFEDVDFLLRMTLSGLTVRYVPQAVARHAGGHSLHTLSKENRELYWYGGLLRYASKHFGRGARGFVSAAVVTGSCLRMVAACLLEHNLKPVVTYAKVMKIAGKSLLGSQTSSNRRATAAASLGR